MFFNVALWSSLIIFITGIVYKIIRFLGISILGDTEKHNLLERLKSALKGLILTLFCLKIFHVIWLFIRDGLFQLRLLRESKIRWLAHSLIFWGFMGLLIVHAMGKIIISPLTDSYYPTVNPYMFLRNLFMVLVLSGVIISVLRRR